MVAVPLRNALIAIQQPASTSDRKSLGITTFVVRALSPKYVKESHDAETNRMHRQKDQLSTIKLDGDGVVGV
jgi:hypothetical protein